MTTTDRYRALTVAEAAAFLNTCGLPSTTPEPARADGTQWNAIVRPLDAWRVLMSGERKPTPISFAGVKYRVEKRHGELLMWQETGDGNGDVSIAFRLLRNGL